MYVLGNCAYDSHANFTNDDPVVPPGVYCVCTDTGLTKNEGDGVSRWSELNPVSTLGSMEHMTLPALAALIGKVKALEDAAE